MPHHGKATQFQERLAMVERSAAGHSDRASAEALEWSYWTVRKWRRKGQRAGRAGLVTVLGRPSQGALSSFAPALPAAIKALRCAHPGWGPQTLRLELRKDRRFASGRLPSRARIAAFLKEQHLTRPYARHTALTQPERGLTAPHAEWEVDAQGVQVVTGVGPTTVINIADSYSRLKVESWGCVGRSKAETADYQLACRRAFMRYGRPHCISLDHDTVFYDSNSPSPFPSRFHLWLLALGIAVRFITQPPPAEHAIIERTHQLLTQQALAEQAFTAPPQMQTSLDARREFLNTEYPSRTWHGQPPLVAHPQAHSSQRPYTPETEAALMDLQRVYHYLAQQRWFRQVSPQGQFSLGAHRYGLGKAWAGLTLEITFDPQTVEFVCTAPDGQRLCHVAAQGLTKADLMGELPPWENLPAYQRRLPFSPAALREDILYREMTGTTS
jgi:hypothetical protein